MMHGSLNTDQRSQITTPAPGAIRAICEAAARHYGITYGELVGPSRARALVRPRHVAIYLARTRLGRSSTDIGRAVGRRDHTTVLHAVRRIEARLRWDEGLRAEIAAMQQRLGSQDDLVAAAQRLVQATDRVAAARGCGAARAHQAEAYRRLKLALKRHQLCGGSHAQP